VTIELSRLVLGAVQLPVITSVSGSLTDGSTLTINGYRFGTKSSETPIIHDDFEGGTLGDDISTDANWTDYNGSGNGTMKYSNSQSYIGTQSARCYFPNESSTFDSVYHDGLGITEMYVSFECYVNEITNTLTSQVMKIFRCNSSPTVYVSNPGFRLTTRPTSPGAYDLDASDRYADGLNPATVINESAWNLNEWTRVEVWVRLSSTLGGSDGIAKAWYRGVKTYDLISGITWAGGNRVIDSIILPAMNDRDGCEWEIFTDNVYVDDTPRRVEISNSPTWEAATTDKVVQVPTAWSNTSISVTAQGLSALGVGSKYLYVIDDNNETNNNGYYLGDT
jgi:hypothetical protein